MEEMDNIGLEMAADQQDAFLDGWDGTEETTEEPEEVSKEPAQEPEEDTAQEPAQEPGDTTQEPEKVQTETVQAPEWTIKHNGAEQVMRAQDITPELLQKGVDYDRIRGKYDEAKPVMELFSGLAKANNMTVPDYIRVVRSAVKKAEGMNEDEAERAIALEDREAAVSAKEAEQQEAEAAEQQQSTKIRSDLQEFAAAFPEVYKQAENDPQTIPQGVWAEVRNGLSLTAAYAKYAVEAARAEASAAKEAAKTADLNRKNSERSTGSMQSAGNENRQKDAFLEGWDS